MNNDSAVLQTQSGAKPLIRASVFAIMLFQVAALFSRQFFMRELVGIGLDPETAKHLSYLIVPVIMLLLLWPILVQNRDPLRRLFRRPQSWSKILMAGTGLGVSLQLAWWSGVFALTSFGMLDTALPDQAIDFSYNFACPPISVLLLALSVTVMITPLTEEIINRGLILGSLSNRDPRIAIVITAILFTMLHELSAMPGAFIFGIFAGLQTLRSGTLWVPIAAHATFNLLAMLKALCVNAIWLPEEPVSGSILLGFGMVLLAAASIGTAIWIVAFMKPGADSLPRAHPDQASE